MSSRSAGSAGRRSPTGSATGASRGSATGARPSPSSTATRAARCRCPRRTCRSCCREDVALTGTGGSPLAAHEASSHARAPAAAARRGARPTPWTPSSSRPGTSRATARRATRHGPFDPAEVAYWLGAGVNQLHRRHRARRPPPLVLALLHQGAARSGLPRPRRAVPRPAHPGHGHQGRRQDEQVEGQCRRPGLPDRALRGRHGAALLSVRRARRSATSTGAIRASTG